jgi:hypothetical protein
MTVAVAAMLGASATAATAHDNAAHDKGKYHHKVKHHDDGPQTNVCGNADQTAVAFPDSILADVEQEAEGPVFCQNGENNTAVNYSPEFNFLDLGLNG